MDEAKRPKLHVLEQRTRGPTYPPNAELAEFLYRLAQQAADGEINQAVIAVQSEAGFSHYHSLAGAGDRLAMAGMLDYLKTFAVLVGVQSS